MFLQKHPVTLEEPRTCNNYCRLTLVAGPPHPHALLCVSVEKAPVTHMSCSLVPSMSHVSRQSKGLGNRSGFATPLRKGCLFICGSRIWLWLSRCLWLNVVYDVAGGLSAGPTQVSRLGCVGINFQDHSLGWWQALSLAAWDSPLHSLPHDPTKAPKRKVTIFL